MSNSEFGSDGQIHDTATEKPLENLAAREEAISADAFEASEPGSAAQRLRAFEDEHVGVDAVRINGEIEKGHGSLFKSLSPAHHRAYGALGRLAQSETARNEAVAAAAQAEAAHAVALQEAEDAAIIERSESEKGSG